MIKKRHLRLVKIVDNSSSEEPATWKDLLPVALFCLPLPLLLGACFVGFREGFLLFNSNHPTSLMYTLSMAGVIGATVMAKALNQRPVCWLGYLASFDALMFYVLLTVRAAL